MLHDITKPGQDSPSVNSHDVANIARVAHGTNSVNYVTGASSLDVLTGGKNGQFTIVDSGIWDGSSTTITTTNPGAGNYVSGGQTVATISHNLGIIPSVLAYYELTNSPLEYDMLPSTTLSTPTSSTALWWTLSHEQDSSNLYIQISWMAFGASFNITLQPVRWYILQQVAN